VRSPRVRVLIAQHRLRIGDTFAAFDMNHDGTLSPAELYGGLKWLGLDIPPSEIASLIAIFDVDADGMISLDEFKQALDIPGMEQDDSDLPAFDPLTGFEGLKPVEVEGMESPSVENVDVPPPCDLPRSTADQIAVKFVSNIRLKQAWTSRGTVSNDTASLWTIETGSGWGGVLTGNKSEQVGLGTYLSDSFEKPGDQVTIELTDGSVWRSSEYLQPVIARLLPCPRRFRQVLSIEKGSSKLFVWEPIPPDTRFVSLSMVCTASNEAPPRGFVRCVPKEWCEEATALARVWTDSVSQASIWSTGQAAPAFWVASKTLDKPEGEAWVLKEQVLRREFKMTSFSKCANDLFLLR